MSNKEPREALGARNGETLLDAARRVVRERDELLRVNKGVARHGIITESIAQLTELLGIEHQNPTANETTDAATVEIKTLRRERDEAQWHAEGLRAALVLVEAERDEARASYEAALRANAACDRERAEVEKERDEARAEVERLSESAKAAWEAECVMRDQRDRYHAEWKQERQEVERLRADRDKWRDYSATSDAEIERLSVAQCSAEYPIAKDAYRRGAEAMREACAQWIPHLLCTVDCDPAEQMRALPIPEDKP